MGLPSHITENKLLLEKLRSFANEVAIKYNLPVYLCGSALNENNSNPRDWDLRIWMPDSIFKKLFGSPEIWEQEGKTGQWTNIRSGWSDICVKITEDGWEHTQLQLDCQICPLSYSERAYGKLNKVILNTVKTDGEKYNKN